ncbi:MAG: twitching motility protein PilT [Comamonadaceae bacterium CG1_02_60_18]|nr:MAG: twitching motility protein PilT [Comamonadaceae bacterium CG1_02_60_18]PIQ51925.1 MAG: PIN domain nuclease [Comamonadaceae bacterium CG12_big_fil_rev_8_21_14_0_65_59_15]
MRVLVDTSVWSLALRRPTSSVPSADQQATVNALADLVRDGRAVLMGAIRQELLSGIKTASQFDLLRERLTAFDDLALPTAVYEAAAQAFNTCRANGVQGSNTDFLICAAALHHQLPIFTLGGDFVQYQRWLPLQLYTPS